MKKRDGLTATKSLIVIGVSESQCLLRETVVGFSRMVSSLAAAPSQVFGVLQAANTRSNSGALKCFLKGSLDIRRRNVMSRRGSLGPRTTTGIREGGWTMPRR